MSKTPNYDARVKAILDATRPGERVCALTGEKWMMTDEEIGWYKKFNVPPSKHAPLTRLKMLSGYFVAFDFWYNTHAQTGKKVLSVIHPESGVHVLPDTEWFKKDFTQQGMVYDREKGFLEQLYALSRAVPRPAHYNLVEPENSIAFLSAGDQDSLFVLACKSKRCQYSVNAFDAEDSVELDLVRFSQFCYNIVHSDRLFQCKFLRESFDCINSEFLFDCRNCSSCFMSANKRNKRYVWENVQCSKEAYEKRRAEIHLTSFAQRKRLEKQFQQMVAQAVWPENFNERCENAQGEYLQEVVNSHDCYRINGGGRNLAYCSFMFNTFSHDCYFSAGGTSDCYLGAAIWSDRSHFCMNGVSHCQRVEYCEKCHDCEDCFGCIGLQKKRFCILNKQYTEQEYWRMLDEIKCRMLEDDIYGALPPLRFSPHHWHSTCLPHLYGVEENEARRLEANVFTSGTSVLDAKEKKSMHRLEDLPDEMAEWDAPQISSHTYFDMEYGRPFRYYPQEIETYKRLGIAAPRQHPSARIYALLRQENKPLFFDTACGACGQVIRVAQNFAFPDRTIYCRACYLEYLEKNG